VNNRRHHRRPADSARISFASSAGIGPCPTTSAVAPPASPVRAVTGDRDGDLRGDVDGPGLSGEPLDQGVGHDLIPGARDPQPAGPLGRGDVAGQRHLVGGELADAAAADAVEADRAADAARGDVVSRS
jgi:hypothetical protein